MRKILLAALLAAMAAAAAGQTERTEVIRNTRKADGNYYMYPNGRHKVSPAPRGYEPFYITHYGRHGSRYMMTDGEYRYVMKFMEQAARDNALTPLGLKTLKRLRKAQADAHGREGELTPLGSRQHMGIARRMYKNYPQVFAPGNTVDARATLIHRCQESMQYCCYMLKKCQPLLNIQQRSRREDYYFMKQSSDSVAHLATSGQVKREARAVVDSLRRRVNVSPRLFRNAGYLGENGGKDWQLAYYLHCIAIDMDCLPELHLDFRPVFSKDQLWDSWQARNASWAVAMGMFEGQTPYYKKIYGLVDNMIAWADEMIAQGKAGASLRFGHDSYVYPLAYVMGFNLIRTIPRNDQARAYRYVADFQVVPMASNIQWVFFRPKGQGDILVKFLLNEDEQQLPIPAYQGVFYRWNDVRAYLKNRMKTL